jgi:hypothetical protein
LNAGKSAELRCNDEIAAKYSSFERDGQTILQIDMYGRASREHPGKLSQTIQLDAEGAAALSKILQREFGLD